MADERLFYFHNFRRKYNYLFCESVPTSGYKRLTEGIKTLHCCAFKCLLLPQKTQQYDPIFDAVSVDVAVNITKVFIVIVKMQQ